MRHTIELTEDSDRALRRIADEGGQSADAVLSTMAETLLAHDSGKSGHQTDRSIFVPIRRNPAVMGGDACVRETRIPVWLLVQLRQAGWSDERVLANYPELTRLDLISAWDFYAGNAPQVEAERRSHEEAE